MVTAAATEIPALHQSTAADLACETAYVAKHVRGKRLPDNLASDRGNDIHRIAAAYVRSCVADRVPADWAEFDRIAAGCGPEAARIVAGIRDNYSVDYEHVLFVEGTFYLDENFQPCTPGEAHYSGTKDIELLLTETMGAIEDWKSHPKPWDPPDVQSDLYALESFQSNPALEQVIFTYRFVRYGNCHRSHTYLRSDVPQLMENIAIYRRRQLAIHAKLVTGEELKALPGPHCRYCPHLVALSCPVAEFNPQASHTPEDRLRFNVWAAELKTQNDEVLQSIVNASGEPIVIRDGNGQEYAYGVWNTESLRFTLPMVAEMLLEWKEATGEDFSEKLFVGSTELKSKLKAKKRAVLDQRMRDNALKISRPRFGIKTPEGIMEEEES